MNILLTLAIIFGGSVLILTIISTTVVMIVKITKGGVSRKTQQQQADEAKMIQEIYRGLSKMEKRIEVIETIVLEGRKKV
ncbi:MAG: phage-shock protein [Deltaproteobacteria bacterium]|nr:phage-shock protein [Deltaproteobacteria bacterium]